MGKKSRRKKNNPRRKPTAIQKTVVNTDDDTNQFHYINVHEKKDVNHKTDNWTRISVIAGVVSVFLSVLFGYKSCDNSEHKANMNAGQNELKKAITSINRHMPPALTKKTMYDFDSTSRNIFLNDVIALVNLELYNNYYLKNNQDLYLLWERLSKKAIDCRDYGLLPYKIDRANKKFVPHVTTDTLTLRMIEITKKGFFMDLTDYVIDSFLVKNESMAK